MENLFGENIFVFSRMWLFVVGHLQSNGEFKFLVVILHFVKHFINENREEESLFKLPDKQAGVRHSSFSLPGVPSHAISWQSCCLKDSISAI